MSTETAPRPDIRFAVTITGDDSYAYSMAQYRHFTARAYILARDKHSDTSAYELHDPDSYSVDTGAARVLAGLQITAQADINSMKRAGDEWYAWGIAYKRTAVKLRDAEEILPVLRKIAKRIDKLSGELGRPKSLAQFCAYAASAVTAERKPFMRRVGPDASDYEGTGYRSMDANDLASHLWHDAAEWRKNHGIDPAG